MLPLSAFPGIDWLEKTYPGQNEYNALALSSLEAAVNIVDIAQKSVK